MTSEAVLFWTLGPLAIAGALGVVTAAKAVYSALFLAMTMISLAVLYIAQDWRHTLPWLGVLFLGVPAHAVWKRFAPEDKMPPA